MVSWPSFSISVILPIRVSIRFIRSAAPRLFDSSIRATDGQVLDNGNYLCLEKPTHDTRTAGRRSQPFARPGRDCPIRARASNGDGQRGAVGRPGAQRTAGAVGRAVPGHRCDGLWTNSPQRLEPTIL